MAKKGFLKAVLFLALFVGLAAGASAQLTFSGGFALSSMKVESDMSYFDNQKSNVGVGGNVYLDYLLPINVPLSFGGEIGIDSAKFKVGDWEDTVLAIPLLFRAAYHFDVATKLDLYLVGKVGVAFGVWKGDNRNLLKEMDVSVSTPVGFAFGFDLGVSYYLTPRMGLFAEVGFDRYGLSAKTSGTDTVTVGSGKSAYTETVHYSGTLDAPFSRFITFGISIK